MSDIGVELDTEFINVPFDSLFNDQYLTKNLAKLKDVEVILPATSSHLAPVSTASGSGKSNNDGTKVNVSETDLELFRAIKTIFGKDADQESQLFVSTLKSFGIKEPAVTSKQEESVPILQKKLMVRIFKAYSRQISLLTQDIDNFINNAHIITKRDSETAKTVDASSILSAMSLNISLSLAKSLGSQNPALMEAVLQSMSSILASYGPLALSSLRTSPVTDSIKSFSYDLISKHNNSSSKLLSECFDLLFSQAISTGSICDLVLVASKLYELGNNSLSSSSDAGLRSMALFDQLFKIETDLELSTISHKDLVDRFLVSCILGPNDDNSASSKSKKPASSSSYNSSSVCTDGKYLFIWDGYAKKILAVGTGFHGTYGGQLYMSSNKFETSEPEVKAKVVSSVPVAIEASLTCVRDKIFMSSSAIIGANKLAIFNASDLKVINVVDFCASSGSIPTSSFNAAGGSSGGSKNVLDSADSIKAGSAYKLRYTAADFICLNANIKVPGSISVVKACVDGVDITNKLINSQSPSSALFILMLNCGDVFVDSIKTLLISVGIESVEDNSVLELEVSVSESPYPHANNPVIICDNNHSLALSSFNEGGYAFGWNCNICKESGTGERWFCSPCTYDCCIACYSKLSENATKKSSFFEICCLNNHPLQPCEKMNGWNCDGRKQPGGCRVNNNKDLFVYRMRCDQCDFDYCGPCYDFRQVESISPRSKTASRQMKLSSDGNFLIAITDPEFKATLPELQDPWNDVVIESAYYSDANFSEERDVTEIANNERKRILKGVTMATLDNWGLKKAAANFSSSPIEVSSLSKSFANNALFSDPQVGVKKTLWLNCRTKSGLQSTISFEENSEIDWNKVSQLSVSRSSSLQPLFSKLRIELYNPDTLRLVDQVTVSFPFSEENANVLESSSYVCTRSKFEVYLNSSIRKPVSTSSPFKPSDSNQKITALKFDLKIGALLTSNVSSYQHEDLILDACCYDYRNNMIWSLDFKSLNIARYRNFGLAGKLLDINTQESDFIAIESSFGNDLRYYTLFNGLEPSKRANAIRTALESLGPMSVTDVSGSSAGDSSSTLSKRSKFQSALIYALLDHLCYPFSPPSPEFTAAEAEVTSFVEISTRASSQLPTKSDSPFGLSSSSSSASYFGSNAFPSSLVFSVKGRNVMTTNTIGLQSGDSSSKSLHAALPGYYLLTLDSNFNMIDKEPRVFSLSTDSGAADRMAEYIDGLPIGQIVMVGTNCSASHKLNGRAIDALKSLGCLGIESAPPLNSLAMIGTKGASPGSALVKFSTNSNKKVSVRQKIPTLSTPLKIDTSLEAMSLLIDECYKFHVIVTESASNPAKKFDALDSSCLISILQILTTYIYQLSRGMDSMEKSFSATSKKQLSEIISALLHVNFVDDKDPSESVKLRNNALANISYIAFELFVASFDLLYTSGSEKLNLFLTYCKKFFNNDLQNVELKIFESLIVNISDFTQLYKMIKNNNATSVDGVSPVSACDTNDKNENYFIVIFQTLLSIQKKITRGSIEELLLSKRAQPDSEHITFTPQHSIGPISANLKQVSMAALTTLSRLLFSDAFHEKISPGIPNSIGVLTSPLVLIDIVQFIINEAEVILSEIQYPEFSFDDLEQLLSHSFLKVLLLPSLFAVNELLILNPKILQGMASTQHLVLNMIKSLSKCFELLNVILSLKGDTTSSPLKVERIVQTKKMTLESAHPYASNTNESIPIVFNGASSLTITFSEQTRTEGGCDFVQFRDESGKSIMSTICPGGPDNFSGGLGSSNRNFPGTDGRPPLVVNGLSRLVLHFHSDGSNEDWGYECTITAAIPTTVTVGSQALVDVIIKHISQLSLTIASHLIISDSQNEDIENSKNIEIIETVVRPNMFKTFSEDLRTPQDSLLLSLLNNPYNPSHAPEEGADPLACKLLKTMNSKYRIFGLHRQAINTAFAVMLKMNKYSAEALAIAEERRRPSDISNEFIQAWVSSSHISNLLDKMNLSPTESSEALRSITEKALFLLNDYEAEAGEVTPGSNSPRNSPRLRSSISTKLSWKLAGKQALRLSSSKSSLGDLSSSSENSLHEISEIDLSSSSALTVASDDANSNLKNLENHPGSRPNSSPGSRSRFIQAVEDKANSERLRSMFYQRRRLTERNSKAKSISENEQILRFLCGSITLKDLRSLYATRNERSNKRSIGFDILADLLLKNTYGPKTLFNSNVAHDICMAAYKAVRVVSRPFKLSDASIQSNKNVCHYLRHLDGCSQKDFKNVSNSFESFFSAVVSNLNMSLDNILSSKRGAKNPDKFEDWKKSAIMCLKFCCLDFETSDHAMLHSIDILDVVNKACLTGDSDIELLADGIVEVLVSTSFNRIDSTTLEPSLFSKSLASFIVGRILDLNLKNIPQITNIKESTLSKGTIKLVDSFIEISPNSIGRIRAGVDIPLSHAISFCIKRNPSKIFDIDTSAAGLSKFDSGMKVMRGRDWKDQCVDDNGVGGIGTVNYVRSEAEGDFVNVAWDDLEGGNKKFAKDYKASELTRADPSIAGHIFSKGLSSLSWNSDDGCHTQWGLYGTNLLPDGTLNVFITCGDSLPFSLRSVTKVTAENWTHVAINIKKTEIFLFINGKLDRSATLPYSLLTRGRISETKFLESAHNYANSQDIKQWVTVDGATRLKITFDSRSKTERGCDYVQFFKDETCRLYWGQEKYHGGRENVADRNFPGIDGRPPLIIEASKFFFHFHSDSSGNDWGYKITIKGDIPFPKDFVPDAVINSSPFYFGQIPSYGIAASKDTNSQLKELSSVFVGQLALVDAHLGSLSDDEISSIYAEKSRIVDFESVSTSESSQSAPKELVQEAILIRRLSTFYRAVLSPLRYGMTYDSIDHIFFGSDVINTLFNLLLSSNSSAIAKCSIIKIMQKLFSNPKFEDYNLVNDYFTRASSKAGQSSDSFIRYILTAIGRNSNIWCSRYKVNQTSSENASRENHLAQVGIASEFIKFLRFVVDEVPSWSSPFSDIMKTLSGNTSALLQSVSGSEVNNTALCQLYGLLAILDGNIFDLYIGASVVNTGSNGIKDYCTVVGLSAESGEVSDGCGRFIVQSEPNSQHDELDESDAIDFASSKQLTVSSDQISSSFVLSLLKDANNRSIVSKIYLQILTVDTVDKVNVETASTAVADIASSSSKIFIDLAMLSHLKCLVLKSLKGILKLTHKVFDFEDELVKSLINTIFINSNFASAQKKNKEIPKPVILESEHNYKDSMKEYREVKIPGASSLSITFDPKSSTEHDCDYVQFLQADRQTVYGERKYSGGRNGDRRNFPGIDGRPPLIIPSDHFVLYFYSDSSNNDWGYKITVTPIINDWSNSGSQEVLDKFLKLSPFFVEVKDKVLQWDVSRMLGNPKINSVDLDTIMPIQAAKLIKSNYSSVSSQDRVKEEGGGELSLSVRTASKRFPRGIVIRPPHKVEFSVNLMSDPSDAAAVLYTINSPTKAVALDQSGSWYYVKFNVVDNSSSATETQGNVPMVGWLNSRSSVKFLPSKIEPVVQQKEPERDCSTPRCQKCHKLKLVESTESSKSWKCDGRKERHTCFTENGGDGIFLGKPRWNCSECNFNYCVPCFEKRKNYSTVSKNSEGSATFLVYDTTTNADKSQGAPKAMRHCCGKDRCVRSQCQSCSQIDWFADPLDFKAVKSVYRVVNQQVNIRTGVSLDTQKVRVEEPGSLLQTVGLGSLVYNNVEVSRVKLAEGNWCSLVTADSSKEMILELVSTEEEFKAPALRKQRGLNFEKGKFTSNTRGIDFVVWSCDFVDIDSAETALNYTEEVIDLRDFVFFDEEKFDDVILTPIKDKIAKNSDEMEEFNDSATFSKSNESEKSSQSVNFASIIHNIESMMYKITEKMTLNWGLDCLFLLLSRPNSYANYSSLSSNSSLSVSVPIPPSSSSFECIFDHIFDDKYSHGISRILSVLSLLLDNNGEGIGGSSTTKANVNLLSKESLPYVKKGFVQYLSANSSKRYQVIEFVESVLTTFAERCSDKMSDFQLLFKPPTFALSKVLKLASDHPYKAPLSPKADSSSIFPFAESGDVRSPSNTWSVSIPSAKTLIIIFDKKSTISSSDQVIIQSTTVGMKEFQHVMSSSDFTDLKKLIVTMPKGVNEVKITLSANSDPEWGIECHVYGIMEDDVTSIIESENWKVKMIVDSEVRLKYINISAWILSILMSEPGYLKYTVENRIIKEFLSLNVVNALFALASPDQLENVDPNFDVNPTIPVLVIPIIKNLMTLLSKEKTLRSCEILRQFSLFRHKLKGNTDRLYASKLKDASIYKASVALLASIDNFVVTFSYEFSIEGAEINSIQGVSAEGIKAMNENADTTHTLFVLKKCLNDYFTTFKIDAKTTSTTEIEIKFSKSGQDSPFRPEEPNRVLFSVECDKWACSNCTYENENETFVCEVCNSKRKEGSTGETAGTSLSESLSIKLCNSKVIINGSISCELNSLSIEQNDVFAIIINWNSYTVTIGKNNLTFPPVFGYPGTGSRIICKEALSFNQAVITMRNVVVSSENKSAVTVLVDSFLQLKSAPFKLSAHQQTIQTLINTATSLLTRDISIESLKTQLLPLYNFQNTQIFSSKDENYEEDSYGHIVTKEVSIPGSSFIYFVIDEVTLKANQYIEFYNKHGGLLMKFNGLQRKAIPKSKTVDALVLEFEKKEPIGDRHPDLVVGDLVTRSDKWNSDSNSYLGDEDGGPGCVGKVVNVISEPVEISSVDKSNNKKTEKKYHVQWLKAEPSQPPLVYNGEDLLSFNYSTRPGIHESKFSDSDSGNGRIITFDGDFVKFSIFTDFSSPSEAQLQVNYPNGMLNLIIGINDRENIVKDFMQYMVTSGAENGFLVNVIHAEESDEFDFEDIKKSDTSLILVGYSKSAKDANLKIRCFNCSTKLKSRPVIELPNSGADNENSGGDSPVDNFNWACANTERRKCRHQDEFNACMNTDDDEPRVEEMFGIFRRSLGRWYCPCCEMNLCGECHSHALSNPNWLEEEDDDNDNDNSIFGSDQNSDDGSRVDDDDNNSRSGSERDGNSDNGNDSRVLRRSGLSSSDSEGQASVTENHVDGESDDDSSSSSEDSATEADSGSNLSETLPYFSSMSVWKNSNPESATFFKTHKHLVIGVHETNKSSTRGKVNNLCLSVNKRLQEFESSSSLAEDSPFELSKDMQSNAKVWTQENWKKLIESRATASEITTVPSSPVSLLPAATITAAKEKNIIPEYTYDEVKEHNSRTDKWLAIEGKVYNITSFLDEHPGGHEILMDSHGDVTEFFYDIGHSDQARDILKNFYIGNVSNDKSEAKSSDGNVESASQEKTKQVEPSSSIFGEKSENDSEVYVPTTHLNGKHHNIRRSKSMSSDVLFELDSSFELLIVPDSLDSDYWAKVHPKMVDNLSIKKLHSFDIRFEGYIKININDIGYWELKLKSDENSPVSSDESNTSFKFTFHVVPRVHLQYAIDNPDPQSLQLVKNLRDQLACSSIDSDAELAMYMSRVMKDKSIAEAFNVKWADIAPNRDTAAKMPLLYPLLESEAPTSPRSSAPQSLWQTLPSIEVRFQSIIKFNKLLFESMSFIDTRMSQINSAGSIANLLSNLREFILDSNITPVIHSTLRKTENRNYSQFECKLNRFRAKKFYKSGDVDNEAKFTVFAQAFRQMHFLNPAGLRYSKQLYKTKLLGEHATDGGGPYRESFSDYYTELQSPPDFTNPTRLLPLLVPCPNALATVAYNNDKFVFNSTSCSSTHLEMFSFLGKLMGIAIRSKEYMSINLAPLIWKLIINEKPSIRDLESIDAQVANIALMKNMSREVFDMTFIDWKFVTEASSFTTSNQPIVPGGENIALTYENRHEYLDAFITFRFHEFDHQVEAVVHGLGTIIPSASLSLTNWHQLERLVCGSPEIDVDLLQSATNYSSCSATDPHIALFWEFLRNHCSNEDRVQFIRYVWGRSRLPLRREDFSKTFTIAAMGGSSDLSLPLAHTCFFTIDLPMYSSLQILKEKILYAIYNCMTIDGDGNGNIDDQMADGDFE